MLHIETRDEEQCHMIHVRAAATREVNWPPGETSAEYAESSNYNFISRIPYVREHDAYISRSISSNTLA